MISLNATVVALACSEELYTETRILLEDKMMPPPPEDDGEIEEDQASLAIVLQIALTAAAMLIGYAAERKHLSWLPEGVCALLLGVFVGIIMHFTEDDEDTILELVDFDPEFFFFVLLPPIIFESGYSMRPYYFFKNIGGICVFAFLGTLVSTVIIGTLMYLAGQIGICDELGILDSLIFGSLISATDPVSVLAVFSKLGTGIHLYNLVFGESVLNDAVALVLYRILLKFHGEDFKFASVFSGIGFFCLVLFGSVAIGVLMALIAGFLYRAIDFRHGALADEFVVLEASFLSEYLACVFHAESTCRCALALTFCVVFSSSSDPILRILLGGWLGFEWNCGNPFRWHYDGPIRETQPVSESTGCDFVLFQATGPYFRNVCFHLHGGLHVPCASHI